MRTRPSREAWTPTSANGFDRLTVRTCRRATSPTLCGCAAGGSGRRRLGLTRGKTHFRPVPHDPAFAGVGRAPCEDQGRLRSVPLRPWRIPANAAGDACSVCFELTHPAGRIAPAPRHACGARVARRTSSAAARRPGGDAMRPARCSPRERGEIRKPVRRRTHRRRHRFVPGVRNTPLSKRSSQGVRIIRAGAAIVRRSPEGRFSARQAEAAPAGCRDDAVERQRPCVLRGLDSRQPCRAALRKVNARTAAARAWRGAHRQRRRDVRAATRCGQRAARRSVSAARSENRSAGAPIGGGTDSSQARGAPRYPNDPRKAFGSSEPEPPS